MPGRFEEEDLDSLFEETLTEYGQCDPPPGLEDWIVAALEKRGRRPQVFRLEWLAAAAAVLVVVLFVSYVSSPAKKHGQEVAKVEWQAVSRPSPDQAIRVPRPSGAPAGSVGAAGTESSSGGSGSKSSPRNSASAALSKPLPPAGTGQTEPVPGFESSIPPLAQLSASAGDPVDEPLIGELNMDELSMSAVGLSDISRESGISNGDTQVGGW